MKPLWIVYNLDKEESFQQLSDKLKELDYPLLEINGDFKKESLSFLKGKDKRCVIFNGSIELTKLIYDELKHDCFPIMYCNWPKYKCSNYYSYFGEFLFNDKYMLLSLKELQRQRFFVWGSLGKDALIFIRPDSGDKPFQAQLLDILDLDRFVEKEKDSENELVLVSTPKNIKWEGRFVVSKHKEIIAHSTYKYQDQITKIPAVPQGALDLCNDILKRVDYCPDSVYCLDLCEGNDGKFYLLELTSFSSAGLYSSDKTQIVQRVSEIALEDFNNEMATS